MSRNFCASRVFSLAFVVLGAATAHGHGDVHERIETLTKKFAEQPSDDILVRRARLYLEQGHAAEARDDLLKALTFAPKRYECHYYLGQAQLMLKQHPQALAAAEQFIAKADNDAARSRGLTLRGDILMAANKPLEAADAYLAALARASDPEPEHYLKAADALHAADQAESLEVLERGIARLGPLTTLQERALAIEMDTGKYEAALRRVERMLATKQRLPFLLYRKGQILTALGRHESAVKTFQAALAEIDKLPAQRRNTRAMAELRAAVTPHIKAGAQN